MNVFAFGVCPSIEGDKSWGFLSETADDCKSRCILIAPVSTVYKCKQHTSKHFPTTIKGLKKCIKIVKPSSPILKDVETLPLLLPCSGCPCQCNSCGGEGLLQVFHSFYQTRVRSLHWLPLSVTDSLHWLLFSSLDWCDPSMWRCQL